MSIIRTLQYSAWCDHAKGTAEQCNTRVDLTPPATYRRRTEWVELELRRRGWRVTPLEQLCPEHRGSKDNGSHPRRVQRVGVTS